MTTNARSDRVLVEAFDVSQHYSVAGRGLFRRKKPIVAVDRVSFAIRRGETLGLVGESGCGKSSLGRAVLQLPRPTSGRVVFDGVEISELSGSRLQQSRRRMQMVFQESYASLNPRMSVGDNIAEPLRIHRSPVIEQRRRVAELLPLVGLPTAVAKRFPHEFSGGQRQRINIARALALEPEFIVCDEPISAVDVSIQAQIINLLLELQDRLHLTYLFISHDLAVVRHICHRVAVMYLGSIVEITGRDALFNEPRHPYTRALLSAIPIPDPRLEAEREKHRVVLSGEVPALSERPSGCCFAGRCPSAIDVKTRFGIECARVAPRLASTSGETEHHVACHLYAPCRPKES